MPKTNFSNLGVTVPAKADKPIAIPSAFEAFAESLGKEQGKGKLLIAQNTGAAAWEQLKGDATLAEDATLTLAAARKPVTWYPPKIINTEEARENAAFGTLSTADEITGIVVPANGLLVVRYVAQVKNSVANAGAAACFVGSNEIFGGNLGESANIFRHLFTNGTALSAEVSTPTVTTGRVLRATEVWELAAGIYNVAIKYKSSSGSVAAKERMLAVEVHGF